MEEEGTLARRTRTTSTCPHDIGDVGDVFWLCYLVALWSWLYLSRIVATSICRYLFPSLCCSCVLLLPRCPLVLSFSRSGIVLQAPTCPVVLLLFRGRSVVLIWCLCFRVVLTFSYCSVVSSVSRFCSRVILFLTVVLFLFASPCAFLSSCFPVLSYSRLVSRVIGVVLLFCSFVAFALRVDVI